MNRNVTPYGLCMAALLVFSTLLPAQEFTIGPSGPFSFDAGSEAARLETYFVNGEQITRPFAGALDADDEQTPYFYQTSNTDAGQSCNYGAGADLLYDVYSFVPATSGTITFSLATNINDIAVSVFEDDFDPESGDCVNWLASSVVDFSANFPTLTVDLVGGRVYYLVVQPRNPNSSATVPQYEVSFNPNGAGGAVKPPRLYPIPELPDGYAITYYALPLDEGREYVIDAQSATGDFSDLTTPGLYQVKGLMYPSSTDPATFVGKSTQTLKDEANVRNETLTFSTNAFFVEVVGGEALPVDWLSFTGTPGTDGIELNWEVAAERDNDYFRVERAAARGGWDDLGEVAGNGTRDSHAAFTFLDASPAAGENVYRIAQVDFDGTVNYSELITVDRRPASASLSAYPNPVTDRLVLTSASEQEVLPRVFDLRGQEVTRRIGIDRSPATATLSVERLPAGVYLVHWGGEQLRFVKM